MTGVIWIMPSRQRPKNIERFIAAWRETEATQPVCVRVDIDDPCLSSYRAIVLPDNWELHIGARVGSSPTYNEALEVYPDADAYGLLGDDAMPFTHFWDVRLSAAAGLRTIAHSSGGDGQKGVVGHAVFGGDVARALGYIMLPGTKRLYSDDAFRDIGTDLGILKYQSDVIIEHWHFSNGKAEMDATYEKPEASADERIYREWINSGGRRRDTDRVRSVLGL